ncbi:DUF937 domain-containing protein [Nonomuraea sp. NBC_01738]|uniref:DUF937 domain-containing protein n=1 Tax=Nonomuraea sp. NBC_01738 TaxID=2976003 RepID=UPI002E1518A4|nr:DUF937 domain-containing protein [Nonomuraea sp. NBC_01738]
MSLNDELLAQLGDPGLQQIAGLLGTDTATARNVIEAASGTIAGGMARNAENPEGAQALRSALDDHVDADPFNGDVATLARDGEGILGHVLGGQGTEAAAQGLSQFAGINASSIMKLLPLIAPMIMSLLANRASNQNMDAGAVAQDLDQEQQAGMSGGFGDLLGELLGGIFGDGVPSGQQEPTSSGQQAPASATQGTNNPDW